MFCVIASEASAGSAASVAELFGIAAADKVADDAAAVTALLATLLAARFAATSGAEDASVDAESSAPQPLSADVASATNSAPARRLSLLMSAPGSVKADAVSNPFKK